MLTWSEEVLTERTEDDFDNVLFGGLCPILDFNTQTCMSTFGSLMLTEIIPRMKGIKDHLSYVGEFKN